MTRLSQFVLLSALPLFGCATDSVVERSQEAAFRGQYFQAYQLLEDERVAVLAGGSEVDPSLEKAYWEARRRYLIEQGRSRLFVDQFAEAQVCFHGALAIAPDDAEAQDLIADTNQKQADREVAIGEVRLARGEIEVASAHFHTALELVPGHDGAMQGVAKVQAKVSTLQGKAQQQYLEALRKYPEFRYVEVNWHASNALAKNPEREDAREIRDKAKHQIAEQTQKRGAEAQKNGRYGAALVEYRSARKAWPQLPGIDELIASMEREVAAQALIDRASQRLRTDRFAEARQILDQAFAKSVLERPTISELMIECRKREGKKQYTTARDLELQDRKAEAIALYAEVAKSFPDGLFDEKTRLGALRSDVDNAQHEWDAAIEAAKQGDAKGALEHYRSVDTFYPNWRDVRARIAEIGKQLEAGKQ